MTARRIETVFFLKLERGTFIGLSVYAGNGREILAGARADSFCSGEGMIVNRYSLGIDESRYIQI